MNKTLLLFFTLLVIQLHDCVSQDIIIKKDGEEVKARVLDVGNKSIRYKNFDDPDFTTYFIKTDEVAKIKFEDGTEKVFQSRLPHYISFVYGIAPSGGNFGEPNPNNPESGYAKTGYSFGLEGGFYLVKNFGIAFSIASYRNDFDTSRFSDPYRGDHRVTLRFDPEHSRWKTSHFMIGPFYSFRVGKKFAFDLKFLLGVVSSVKPGFGLSYSDPGPPFDAFYYYQDADGAGLGINPGVAFRYNFSRRIGLRAGLDFIAAKVSLHNQVEIEENGIYRLEDNAIRTQIAISRPNIGLVFLINR